MTKIPAVVLLFGLIVPVCMTAHDPSKHKGRAIHGELVSVSPDRFELKTANGVKVITFTDKTKFERGNDPASKTDFKKGDHVAITGTTLASGEVVAREVIASDNSHTH